MKISNSGEEKTTPDFLSLNNLKALNKIAGAWQIKGRSKLKKDELIESIVAVINQEFISVYLTFNNEHMIAMENPEKISLDPNYHSQETKELMTLGLLFQGEDKFYLYPKIKEHLKEMKEKYPSVIENNSFVKLCLETIIAYRGIIIKDEAVKTIQDISKNEMPQALIEMIIEYTTGRTRNVYETDGYLHEHRLTDINLRLETLNSSLVSKVYDITLEDVGHYTQNYYIYKGKGFESFVEVLTANYLSNKYEVIDLLDQLNLMILYGYKPSDYMRMVAGNLKITDGVALKILADACMAFYNEMPQWLINGFSPNQLSGVKAEPVKKAEKISRNAPCPCGSGKKYKHCCLN